MAQILILIAFMLADRFAGGDYVAAVQIWVTRHLASTKPSWLAKAIIAVVNARSVAWAALALAFWLGVIAFFTYLSPKLMLFAVTFAIWRWDGWVMFGSGGIDSHGWKQSFGYFLRHLLALPFVLVSWWMGHDPLLSIVLIAVWATFASVLGDIEWEFEKHGRDINAYIEAGRGAALGLAVVAMLAT